MNDHVPPGARSLAHSMACVCTANDGLLVFDCERHAVFYKEFMAQLKRRDISLLDADIGEQQALARRQRHLSTPPSEYWSSFSCVDTALRPAFYHTARDGRLTMHSAEPMSRVIQALESLFLRGFTKGCVTLELVAVPDGVQYASMLSGSDFPSMLGMLGISQSRITYGLREARVASTPQWLLPIIVRHRYDYWSSVLSAPVDYTKEALDDVDDDDMRDDGEGEDEEDTIHHRSLDCIANDLIVRFDDKELQEDGDTYSVGDVSHVSSAGSFAMPFEGEESRRLRWSSVMRRVDHAVDVLDASTLTTATTPVTGREPGEIQDTHASVFGRRRFSAACFCVVAHVHRRHGLELVGCTRCEMTAGRCQTVGGRWADCWPAYRVLRTILATNTAEFQVTHDCLGCRFLIVLAEAARSVAANGDMEEARSHFPLPNAELIDRRNRTINYEVCRGLLYEALSEFENLSAVLQAQERVHWAFDDVNVIRVQTEALSSQRTRVYLNRRQPSAMQSFSCETTVMVLRAMIGGDNDEQTVSLDTSRDFLDMNASDLDACQRAWLLNIGRRRGATLCDQIGNGRNQITSSTVCQLERPTCIALDAERRLISIDRFGKSPPVLQQHRLTTSGFDTYGPRSPDRAPVTIGGATLYRLAQHMLNHQSYPAISRQIRALAIDNSVATAVSERPALIVEHRQSFPSHQYAIVLDTLTHRCRVTPDTPQPDHQAYSAVYWITQRLNAQNNLTQIGKTGVAAHAAQLSPLLDVTNAWLASMVQDDAATWNRYAGEPLVRLFIGTLRSVMFRNARGLDRSFYYYLMSRIQERFQDKKRSQRSIGSRRRCAMRGPARQIAAQHGVDRAARSARTSICNEGYAPSIITALWAFCNTNAPQFYVPRDLAGIIAERVVQNAETEPDREMVQLARRICSVASQTAQAKAVVPPKELADVMQRVDAVNDPDEYARFACHVSVACRTLREVGTVFCYYRMAHFVGSSMRKSDAIAAWYRMIASPVYATEEERARAFLSCWSTSHNVHVKNFGLQPPVLQRAFHPYPAERFDVVQHVWQCGIDASQTKSTPSKSTPLASLLSVMEMSWQMGNVDDIDLTKQDEAVARVLARKRERFESSFDLFVSLRDNRLDSVSRMHLSSGAVFECMRPDLAVAYVASRAEPVASIVSCAHLDNVDVRKIDGIQAEQWNSQAWVRALEQRLDVQVVFCKDTLPMWQSFYYDDRLDPSGCSHAAPGGLGCELLPLVGTHPMFLPCVVMDQIGVVRAPHRMLSFPVKEDVGSIMDTPSPPFETSAFAMDVSPDHSVASDASTLSLSSSSGSERDVKSRLALRVARLRDSGRLKWT